MAVKAIMVDVDGVIVRHPHPKGWAANLEADLGLRIEDLETAFFRPHFQDVACGRATLRERLGPVLATIAPHLTYETLRTYWFERAAYLWTHLRLKDHFDAMHYSAAIGHAKPDPEFYAAIEAATGFAPNELFYIDDREICVEAARSRGWPAAVWTGKNRLADLLVKTDVELESR